MVLSVLFSRCRSYRNKTWIIYQKRNSRRKIEERDKAEDDPEIMEVLVREKMNAFMV